ncbi:PEPxxWA-CTERM sorting domain-containing protein [Erythrobacter fulvus]|uniref:PEPxxWA-CTERM sorting domain-containing protein n=1 Tax=Erythrobacter fulvus TaxID=2987523 RepID=UPI002358BC06|nr:PEPxxWA-CTERM sorting domain-containing protein [Erythrobacter fulvus]
MPKIASCLLPLVAASLIAATPAGAVTFAVGAEGAASGQDIVCDFDGKNCESRISGDAVRLTSSVGSVGRTVNGTGYLAIPGIRGTGDFVGSINLADLRSTVLSFDWGSIDRYNSVRIFTSDNPTGVVVLASQLGVALGANLDRNFSASTGNASVFFTRVDFLSTQAAFEIDNVAVKINSAVPEPGTWLLMILGLGAVGFAMRRRPTTSVRFQFA